ncbi:MAG TPA: glycosyltransferase family 1 protein [Candidatus Binatia bacterium]|nr:glycosyltransferase family 1 protein [Candidatus Binatia bacterium]
MKTIVIDARESGTTTGRYMDKLIEYLYKLQPPYDFIILTRHHRVAYMAHLAPRFKTIATSYKEFTFDEQIAFKKQIESLKADLVHFCIVQQPVFYRRPVVTTMQDLTTVRFKNPDKNPVVFTIKQQVYKWVNKRVAHKSRAIITPTQFVKDDVVSFTGIDPAKITVTHESADKITERAEPLKSLESKEFIMYIGRPTPHKNLERLIQAFVALQAAHPDLKLVLAGKKDANYERIEARVKFENIENVIFTDFISEGNLRWLYEHCAAYVVPSLSEGFGLPGLEAMVHGAPVLSSNATCLPEVYGQAAHYFDPLDVSAMASAINDVLTDKALKQKLIEAGEKQVKKYSWQRMAEQTLAVYDKCLS